LKQLKFGKYVEPLDAAIFILRNTYFTVRHIDARGGAVVEELRYKPEGSGIDSRWCH
jgi:hypothetical protein